LSSKRKYHFSVFSLEKNREENRRKTLAKLLSPSSAIKIDPFPETLYKVIDEIYHNTLVVYVCIFTAHFYRGI